MCGSRLGIGEGRWNQAQDWRGPAEGAHRADPAPRSGLNPNMSSGDSLSLMSLIRSTVIPAVSKWRLGSGRYRLIRTFASCPEYRTSFASRFSAPSTVTTRKRRSGGMPA
jgi:hypothetical protein